MKKLYGIAASLLIGVAMLGAARADDGGQQGSTAGQQRFAIQLGSFQDDVTAQEWKSKLKALHIPAYTERRKQSDGSTRTLLRAGPFESRDAASDAIARVRAVGLGSTLPSAKPASKRDVSLERQIVAALAPIIEQKELYDVTNEESAGGPPDVLLSTAPHCVAQSCLGVQIFYEKEPCSHEFDELSFEETSRWDALTIKAHGICYEINSPASDSRLFSDQIAASLETVGTLRPNQIAKREETVAPSSSTDWMAYSVAEKRCVKISDMGAAISPRFQEIDTPEKFAALIRASTDPSEQVKYMRDGQAAIVEDPTLDDGVNQTFWFFANGPEECALLAAAMKADGH